MQSQAFGLLNALKSACNLLENYNVQVNPLSKVNSTTSGFQNNSVFMDCGYIIYEIAGFYVTRPMSTERGISPLPAFLCPVAGVETNITGSLILTSKFTFFF